MSDSIQNSTRYVVHQRHPGGVVPGTRMEMWRDIYLRSGAVVEGGIFGNSVAVSGPDISVAGSVYARGAISIAPGEEPAANSNPVVFKSCVCTPDSIAIDPGLEYLVRFGADVYAGQLKLQNVVVRGNLFAKNVIIRNSIVLGGIFSTGSLTIEDSIISTFRARSVRLGKNLMMLLPVGFSETPFTVTSEVRSLLLHPFVRGEQASVDKAGGVVAMSEADVIEIQEKREDQTVTLHMLSLCPRILDLTAARDLLRANKNWLSGFTLGDHLQPQERKRFDAALIETEQKLLALLKDPPQHEARIRLSLDEVAGRPATQSFLSQASA